jgi:predicted ATP-grasp superfamily ATP-dependent carboligase
VQRYGGAKWIYLRHDLQSAFHYWRQGELSPAQWLRSLKGVRRDAVLKLSDPGPGLADFRNSVRAAVFGRPHASASRRIAAGETRVPST